MYRLILLIFVPMIFAQSPGNYPPHIVDVSVSTLPFFPDSYILEVEAADANRDPITFHCTTESRDLSILVDGSNRIQIDVNPGARSGVITVAVTDDHGGEATQTWDFLDMNRPPVIYKYLTTRFLAENGSSNILSANISDPDGDHLSYSFGFAGPPSDLVQISSAEINRNVIQSDLTYHASQRGIVNLQVEVSDRNGGTATSTLKVQVGKILRKVGFWNTAIHGVNPYAIDLDRDGNLIAIGVGSNSDFVKMDQNGNLLDSGPISNVMNIRGLAVQKHLAHQPLIIGTSDSTSWLNAHSNDGSIFLGDLGFPHQVLYLVQLTDNSNLIAWQGNSQSGIMRRDSLGNFTDIVPGGGAGGPRQIAINQSNGDFYLADSGRAKISAFEADGTFIREYPSPDVPYRQPHGVFCDVAENVIFVCDTQNNRILVFDLETGVHYQTYSDTLYFTPRFMRKLNNGKLVAANFSRGGFEIFGYQ